MQIRVAMDDVWHVAAVVQEVAAALRAARATLDEAGAAGWAVTHDLPSRVGAVLAELDRATTAGSAVADALSSHYAVAAQGYEDADVLRAPR